MKLEVGKVYKDGKENLIKIVYIQENECMYPVLGVMLQEEEFCPETIVYTLEGKYNREEDDATLLDLVEEVDTFDWGNIPDWVNYITTDRYGTEVWHESEPTSYGSMDGKVQVWESKGKSSVITLKPADDKTSIRIRPKVDEYIEVNGFKVKKGVDKVINTHYYYVVNVGSSSFFSTLEGESTYQLLVSRGLVHKTKEDVIAHAKAMLGINPNGEENV